MAKPDIRNVTLEDSEALVNLFRKMDIVEIGSPMTTNTDVQNLLQESDIGSWASIKGSQVVAFGSLRKLPNVKEVRAQFGCLPEHVDTTTEMLEWLIGHAQGNGANRISLWQVTDGIAAPYLNGAGFKPVRRYIRMVLDLTQPLSKPPMLEQAITIIQATKEAHFQLVHQLIEETLADHWDHSHLDFDTFMSTQAARPGHNPRLWYIAYLGARPAGAIVGRLDGAKGQVALLGTKAEFRSRGVATTLLLKIFSELKSSGAIEVVLDVDTDNATDAVRVYKSAGMKIEFSSEQWKIEI